MGCDIHMYAEYRKKNSDKWEADPCHKVRDEDEHYKYVETLPDGGRDYGFFYALAGVRYGNVGPYNEPKGIPADVSEIVKIGIDSYGADGHSHTYFSLEEYERIVQLYTRESGDSFWSEGSNGFKHVIDHCAEVMEKSRVDAILLDAPEQAYEECRLVIYFDN